ncbi:MAG: family 43 glycosylhydrolase [Kiritimatiellae bacterium]|jgi:arabinan endo-1,5-alpha-L-arabinosidase|nr:family 43 glycosylhydrolase [Kiritimatiellia bacterium]
MEIPVITGGYREIIAAAPEGETRPWFTNDHSFIRGNDGQWHCFAINNPMVEREVLYREHPYLLHATSGSIGGSWTRRGFAIDESGTTRYVGAPCVVCHDGQYLMMVETMWGEKRGLEIARSDDLAHWTRDREEVILNQPPLRRDPCIIRDDESGDWLIYLCSPGQGLSRITFCRTTDFRVYSEPRMVLSLDDGCPWGSLESPFVVRRDGYWYLFFTHSMHHYRETVVLVSETCDRFDWSGQITTLHAHAAEIVRDGPDWYISSCGPEDRRRNSLHGIELAPLQWLRF